MPSTCISFALHTANHAVPSRYDHLTLLGTGFLGRPINMPSTWIRPRKEGNYGLDPRTSGSNNLMTPAASDSFISLDACEVFLASIPNRPRREGFVIRLPDTKQRQARW